MTSTRVLKRDYYLRVLRFLLSQLYFKFFHWFIIFLYKEYLVFNSNIFFIIDVFEFCKYKLLSFI